MRGVFAHARVAQMVAGTAQLMDQVMQCRARGTGGRRHFGAAESIERMHGKVLLEHARGMFGEEGVAIVGNRIRQVAELRSLMIGD